MWLNSIRLFILQLIVFVVVCTVAEPAASTSHQTDVLIEKLLTQVQRALIRVQNETVRQDLPQLKSVQLKLSTQLKTEAGGGFKFLIVTVEGGGSKATTQTLELTLTPPRPGAEMPVSTQDVSEGLAEAIIAASRGTETAITTKPNLELSKLVASIKFVVSAQGGGGLSFQILPVDVSLIGKVNSISTQELIITFKNQ